MPFPQVLVVMSHPTNRCCSRYITSMATLQLSSIGGRFDLTMSITEGLFEACVTVKLKNWYILVPHFFPFLHNIMLFFYNDNIIISWLLLLKSYYHGLIVIAQKSQGSIFKFVKDQWNVSHDSLIHVCSLSASWFHR